VNRVGVFVEVSINVIGKDYAQRVFIHNDVCEVNAAINLEDLMKDFDLSSKRGEDVFLSHLLAKHFLDADQGLKSLMSVFGDVASVFNSDSFSSNPDATIRKAVLFIHQ
jgi:hypothetical protein